MAVNSRGRERSDGYYHAQITYGLMPFAFVLGMYMTPHAEQAGTTALLCMFGCWLGVFISPDLDLPGLTFSEWKVIRIPFIGRYFLGPIFVMIWFPYSMLFRHRSFWSHGPGISTIIRILYMLSIYYAIRAVVPALNLPELSGMIESDTQKISCMSIIAGLMLSDIGHWMRDIGILS